jgi:hypothetical protein
LFFIGSAPRLADMSPVIASASLPTHAQKALLRHLTPVRCLVFCSISRPGVFFLQRGFAFLRWTHCRPIFATLAQSAHREIRAQTRGKTFCTTTGGELGRGAELSLLFWGNRSAPSWPPPFKRPIVLSANAVPPCHTHVLGRGDRAGIKHANTIDISLIDVPAFRPRPCHQTADLRNHVVWRRGRHGHGHGKGKGGTDHHYFFALKARR